jgi:hypothetical protein
VRVEGPGVRLGDVVTRHRLDALIYALPGQDETAAAAWVERARAAGVPLERVPGALEETTEPHAIVLDRVVRALGREDASSSLRAQPAVRGRRVMVTHGGERIGASLLTTLRMLDAIPVVHFDGPRERSLAGLHSVGTCTGSLLADADALVAAADADVVVHVVTVEPVGGLNDDAFAWEHLVRESDALARAVWRRPGCRLVIAALWGHTRAGDAASHAAATMEAVVLNRAQAEPAAVVRLPRVLTAEQILAPHAVASRVAYDLLENEAANLVIQVAAGAYRGIYAPAPRPEFGLATARDAAIERPGSGAPLLSSPRGVIASGVIFPPEHLDECGIDGGRRVLSPLFPAADPFRRLVLDGALDVDAGERGEWVRAVGAVVQPRALSGAGPGPVPSA